jgi:hypothetical protein
MKFKHSLTTPSGSALPVGMVYGGFIPGSLEELFCNEFRMILSFFGKSSSKPCHERGAETLPTGQAGPSGSLHPLLLLLFSSKIKTFLE